MRIPDFFIVGASKCGTTALSEYLSQHPRICFARTKEPHFFSDDFPRQKVDDNFVQYWRRNFSYFDALKHKAIGEGSGTYYISDVAVKNILTKNPAAKFIYMVRNPVEMVYSWHYHVQFGGGPRIGLEDAWNAQPAGAHGLELRQQDGDQRFLQYRTLASLGHWLEKLKSVVPPNQLMVIVLDDLMRDPKAVYEEVLSFIGVPSDGRESFPIVNQNRVQRSRVLGFIGASIPRWVVNSAREFKHLAGLSHVSLNFIVRLNSKPAKRPPLPNSFRSRLVMEFEQDVRLLERHLGRDLSGWRT